MCTNTVIGACNGIPSPSPPQSRGAGLAPLLDRGREVLLSHKIKARLFLGEKKKKKKNLDFHSKKLESI